MCFARPGSWGLASLQLAQLPQIAIGKERASDGKKQWWQKEPRFPRRGDRSWHACAVAPAISSYTLQGEKSSIWLMAGRQGSDKFYIYIYMYISPRRSARLFPLEAKPTGFPRQRGRTGVEREQMCSTSSTWALGHSATTTVLYQRPGTVLMSFSHLRAVHPLAEVDWEAGTQGRCTLTFIEERWQLSPSPSHVQSTEQEASTKKDLPRSETPQQALWDHIPTRPAMSPTLHWDQEGRGWDRPGTVSMGAQESLWFGGNLGGSWSHLLACSLYKYLLRGQDIKPTVQ